VRHALVTPLEFIARKPISRFQQGFQLGRSSTFGPDNWFSTVCHGVSVRWRANENKVIVRVPVAFLGLFGLLNLGSFLAPNGNRALSG
jgi:hypothetical protein